MTFLSGLAIRGRKSVDNSRRTNDRRECDNLFLIGSIKRRWKKEDEIESRGFAVSATTPQRAASDELMMLIERGVAAKVRLNNEIEYIA